MTFRQLFLVLGSWFLALGSFIMRKYLSLLCILIVSHVSGQEAVIKILDKQSKSPVTFANICFESIDKKKKSYTTSGEQGEFKNLCKTKSTLAISSLGYVSQIDTILPNRSFTIYLQPTTYDFNEVVVTGQFKAVRADKSIYKINIINNRQIEDKAANNLGELLSSDLTMRTSQNGVLGTDLSIQGLSGEYVKFLVDGVPVIGRQNGILDLSQINLSSVDHIEIVEGPMSVVYGSDALAGAVNVISKEPTHGKVWGKATGYFESVGVYNFNSSVGKKIGHHLLNVNLSRNFFKGYSPIDTSRAKLWKPKLQYNANFDYYYTDNQNKLHFSSTYLNEELRNNGNAYYIPTITQASDTVIKVNHGYAMDGYYYTSRWNNSINYQRKFNNDDDIQTILSYSTYKKIQKTISKNLETLNGVLADETLQDTTLANNFIWRTVYSHNKESWLNFQTGYEANIETASGKRLDGQKRIDDYAAFFMAKLFNDRKLNGQLGLRTIYNSKFIAPVIYSFNIKYSPLEQQTFRASYGKGFRSPSLKELYLVFNDINHNVQGNDSLQAETSHNFNLSSITKFTIDQQVITVDASAFYNIIHNKIDFEYKTDDPTWAKYFNIIWGNYLTRGVDMKIQYQLHPRFNFNAGVYYLQRSRIPDVKKVYQSTDYTANFNYKNLRYLFRLSVYYKYTDNFFASRANFNADQTLSSISESFMQGYHNLDITLSRPFFNNALEIGLGGKNLFDNKNVLSSGGGSGPHSGSGNDTAVGWGRTFFVRISYNFLKI